MDFFNNTNSQNLIGYPQDIGANSQKLIFVFLDSFWLSKFAYQLMGNTLYLLLLS